MYTFFTSIHHLPLCVHDCDFVVLLIHEWLRASNYAKASLVKPLLNEYLIKHQENKTEVIVDTSSGYDDYRLFIIIFNKCE